MPTTAWAASVAQAKSSNTPSSVASTGMHFVASVRPLSLSCSRISTRSTSLLTRLTRTTPALRTGHRLHRLMRTSTRRACPSLGTRTSASTRTGDLRAFTHHNLSLLPVGCWTSARQDGSTIIISNASIALAFWALCAAVWFSLYPHVVDVSNHACFELARHCVSWLGRTRALMTNWVLR
jgi:hypothetical protein